MFVLLARRTRQKLTLDGTRQDFTLICVKFMIYDEREEEVEKDEAGEALEVLCELRAGGRKQKFLVHAEY